MKPSGRSLAAIVLCGLLAGCAAPTPQQLQRAEEGRAQVTLLLDQFVEAMRTQSPGGLRELLSPAIRQREARRLEAELGWASWLTLHADYTLDVDRALDRVSWRKWQEPSLLLEIHGENMYGAPFLDTFRMARTDDEWYLADFSTALPRRGSAIDPPGDIREAIAPQAAALLEALAEGKTGTILYEMLPDGTRRARMPVLSLWQRITGGGPGGAIPIYVDLEMIRKFHFASWPDATEDMELAFAPPNGVIAIYEVQYVWRGADLEDIEYLRVEVTFMPSDQGWDLTNLYLSGEGIPFST